MQILFLFCFDLSNERVLAFSCFLKVLLFFSIGIEMNYSNQTEKYSVTRIIINLNDV